MPKIVLPISARIVSDDHPHSPPLTINRAKPDVVAVIATDPIRSGRRALGSRMESGKTRAPQISATTPIGIFNAKAQRHELSSITNPPITGPTAEDKARVELQIVTAVARRSTGKAAIAIPKDAGAAIAAPTPIKPRAITSNGTLGAIVNKADPRTKHIKPLFRTRPRPKRSAHRPLTIRAPA